MENLLNEFKKHITHDLEGKMAQTKSETIERFAVHPQVLLLEYKIDPEQCVTIGFAGTLNEVKIFLFSSTIKTIKENIKTVTEEGKNVEFFTKKRTKLINPVVFTVQPNRKKSFQIHPNHGHFINALLLTGYFEKAFKVILRIGQKIISEKLKK